MPLWVNHIGTLDSTAEYRGNTGAIDEVDDYQAILAGLRYTLVNGLAAQAGMDFGLSNSVQRYNVLAGISYTGPQPPVTFGEPGKERIVYRDRVIQVEKVQFQDVTFEFDKATLTDVGRGRCYLIAQKLKEGKNVKIEIQGHTDYIGTDDYNKKLGMQRAETVKAELIRLGVDASRISTVSYGEDRPLIDMQTPWARAVNRRAEFVVVSEPTATSGNAEPAPETSK
jgi:OOP family OmpA-OmpF porin